MLKIYPFLLALSWGLLAGCSPDRPAREQPATAAPTASADTARASRPAALPLASGARTDTASGPDIFATTGVRGPITEKLAAPRIKRGATVFADVPDEEMPSEEIRTESVSPANPATVTELARFLQTGLPAPHVFRIRPGRDTLVLFGGVPQAQEVTLVALRRENGITYLATRDVKAEELLYGGLVYHPVTMAELRAELARLN